ncbi:soma ferritin [Lingula anatina]|uniref:Ferritin n=1 Tax=Lingula anatina TaxID=7574 RepID=A0A1S3J5E8_LINAN|nr:soma ferritin [Lingula anatina]|eukprot:XP_013378768.1 soma ferritin [Lingula anatina]
MSLARQNYHVECEAAVNKQINLEFYASYVYDSMSAYFDRDDVALPGFSAFFRHQADEEREHAFMFIKFQNTRGGRVVLQPIPKPSKDEWGSGLDAMKSALEIEKETNQALLDLHKMASKHHDTQMGDFIEETQLTMMVEEIKHISDYITTLQKVGPGLGEWLFDKEHLQHEYMKNGCGEKKPAAEGDAKLT